MTMFIAEVIGPRSLSVTERGATLRSLKRSSSGLVLEEPEHRFAQQRRAVSARQHRYPSSPKNSSARCFGRLSGAAVSTILAVGESEVPPGNATALRGVEMFEIKSEPPLEG